MQTSKRFFIIVFALAALLMLIAGVNSGKSRVIIDAPTADQQRQQHQHQHQQKRSATGSTVAQPAASHAPASQADAGNAIQTPALNTHRTTPGKYHTHAQHDHQQDEPVSIPVEIRAYIEKQRIPASELVATPNGDGSYSLNPRGQFETVSIAVLDDDGDVQIVERQIQPISAAEQQRKQQQYKQQQQKP